MISLSSVIVGGNNFAGLTGISKDGLVFGSGGNKDDDGFAIELKLVAELRRGLFVLNKKLFELLAAYFFEFYYFRIFSNFFSFS